jgi:hypothetical protein
MYFKGTEQEVAESNNFLHVADWRVLLNAATNIRISLMEENWRIKLMTTDSNEEHCPAKLFFSVNTHTLVSF